MKLLHQELIQCDCEESEGNQRLRAASRVYEYGNTTITTTAVMCKHCGEQIQ